MKTFSQPFHSFSWRYDSRPIRCGYKFSKGCSPFSFSSNQRGLENRKDLGFCFFVWLSILPRLSIFFLSFSASCCLFCLCTSIRFLAFFSSIFCRNLAFQISSEESGSRHPQDYAESQCRFAHPLVLHRFDVSPCTSQTRQNHDSNESLSRLVIRGIKTRLQPLNLCMNCVLVLGLYGQTMQCLAKLGWSRKRRR